MSRAQSEISVLGATRIVVGLSAIVKINPSGYQYAQNIRILSGGGTLEIVPPPSVLSGAGAAGWGLGYPIGSGEAVAVDGGAVAYLAATGATMTVTMLIGYTSGATVPS